MLLMAPRFAGLSAYSLKFSPQCEGIQHKVTLLTGLSLFYTRLWDIRLCFWRCKGNRFKDISFIMMSLIRCAWPVVRAEDWLEVHSALLSPPPFPLLPSLCSLDYTALWTVNHQRLQRQGKKWHGRLDGRLGGERVLKNSFSTPQSKHV